MITSALSASTGDSSGGRYFCVAIVMLIAALTLWLRLGALDPATLWTDDLLYAVLAKASLATALSVPAHVSPGFIGLSWVMLRVFGDPEWSLQVLPLAASVLAIPLTALLVWRLTASHGIAIIAAGLAATNPLIAHYSVYVKPYTFEFLGGCLLLLAATRSLQPAGWQVRDQARTALLGAALLPLATPTGLIAAPIVYIGGLATIWKHRLAGRRVAAMVAVMAGFNAWAVAVAWLLRARATQGIRIRHEANFMPVQDVAESGEFALQSLRRILQLGVPGNLSERLWMPDPANWPLLFMAVGLVALLRSEHHRLMGLSMIGPGAAALTASALGFYPVAMGRTDAWFFAIPILLFCVGLHALLARLARREAIAWALGVTAIVFLMVTAPTPHYWPLDQRDIVSTLDQRLADQDALVLSPEAVYLVGYYGRWPMFLTARRGGSGTVAEIVRDKTLHTSRDNHEPELLRFLAQARPGVLWYLAYRESDADAETTLQRLRGFGYEPQFEQATRGARLVRLALARRLESLVIDVGEPADSDHLGVGWSLRELEGGVSYRWTEGPDASLLVPLAVKGSYQLTFAARPFDYDGRPEQRIEVAVNGAAVETVLLATPRLWGYRVVIPAPNIRRGMNSIELRFAYHTSPASLGLSSDARQLGVMFDRLELSPLR